MKRLFASIALAATLLTAPFTANAGETLTETEARALVQPFYDLLSRKATVEEARAAFHEDWKSYYSATGYKGLDDTMNMIGGAFPKMVPDINWEILEVYVTADNEIIVRGNATGTPAGGKFFGQPTNGKGFEIMSIDIHKVVDGKVKKTYHIEDWFNALNQLRPKS